MIYDTFEKIDLYYDNANPLHMVLSYAAAFDKSKADGRYEIDSDNIYAIVMTYGTKDPDELKFESHKKYIDVQLMLEGQEFLDVALDENLDFHTSYSEQDDAALFRSPQHYTSVLLRPGNFTVLYPHDIHRPSRKIEKENQVRKMVIKVRVKC